MLEAELFAFLEKTADAAFAVTREGQICSWNQAAERLFGYSSADVLNRACYEVLDGHGALGTQVCIGDCSVQQCAAQKVDIPDFDLEVKTRSGERLWVNVSTLVFEEPRRNRHLVVHLARDISHRKKSEELLAKMLEISKEVVAVADQNTRVVAVADQNTRVVAVADQNTRVVAVADQNTRVVAVADQNTRVAPISPLSDQEQRILRLFAKAKNSSEIARDLGITLPTLRNHLHSINEKLRTHNRLEAVMHAMQRGLI